MYRYKHKFTNSTEFCFNYACRTVISFKLEKYNWNKHFTET